jgi:tetratricopeptide (TPR) repeat protein
MDPLMRRSAAFIVVLLAASPVRAQTAIAACSNPNTPPDQTIAACTQVLQSGSLHGTDLAVAYNNRGVGYLSKGRYDDAIRDFTQAVRLDPKEPAFLIERADAYARNGHADLAITDYTGAARLDPNLADAYYKRGLLYDETGRLDLAIADYTHALKIKPTDAVALYYRGMAYHRNGKDELAKADFTQALRINPNLKPAQEALQDLTH